MIMGTEAGNSFFSRTETVTSCAGGDIVITEAEGPALYRAAVIHSVSWQESHRAFCTPEFVNMHTPERQLRYLRDKRKHGSRVFLLSEGEPVGLVSVTGSLIEDLYILPEKQCRGYGTRLLRYAVGQCTGIPTLWILENNTRAKRLYLALGFRETGRVSAVTKGLNEIEMSLTGPLR